MMPSVTLTQQDMEILFAKWNTDAEKNGWDKNAPDAAAQAEHFFKEAEAHLNAKTDG